jgi:nucleotide-binding universal stress UspA family protein
MKRVLVAIDGSEGSLTAVDWAADFAETSGAEVIAASVYGVEPIATMAGYAIPEDMEAQWRTELQSDLDGQWTARLRELGIAVTTVVTEGRPGDELLRIAQENHVDLVVVGTRGRGGVREMLLGSVSHFLTTHAPCPVVVVPRVQISAVETTQAATVSAH